MDHYNNELDIAYYEFLIDQIQEEQKIHEMLTISKYSHVLEGFDDEQIAIYEGKIINAIIEFIKSLIEKVRNFFGKASKAVKNIKNDNADKKLYDSVDQKIKTMSSEDAKKFSVQINRNIAEIEDNIKDSGEKINSIDKLFKDASTIFTLVLPVKLNNDAYHTLKNQNKKFEEFSDRLFKLNSDLENIDYEDTENSKDKEPGVEFIDFNAIKDILSECKGMDSQINKVESQLKDSNKEMEFYKNWAERAEKENINAEVANRCKNLLSGMSVYSIRVYKMHINLYLLRNSLYKGALRKFVAYKSESASNESVEYFNRLLESMMYNETEDGGTELCMS